MREREIRGIVESTKQPSQERWRRVVGEKIGYVERHLDIILSAEYTMIMGKLQEKNLLPPGTRTENNYDPSNNTTTEIRYLHIEDRVTRVNESVYLSSRGDIAIARVEEGIEDWDHLRIGDLAEKLAMREKVNAAYDRLMSQDIS